MSISPGDSAIMLTKVVVLVDDSAKPPRRQRPDWVVHYTQVGICMYLGNDVLRLAWLV